RDEQARAEPLSFNPLPTSKGILIPGFVRAIREGGDSRGAALREFDLIRVIAATEHAHQSSTQLNIEYTP
ncbi:MAG: hypothetical protein NWR87_09485, partial [Rhodospirillales bacterium]|nr:hypothetical protein [Rhodospirillales bacterium]